MMKFKEMIQIVNMFYNEWDLGKKQSQSKGKVCAWIFLFETLEVSEKWVLKYNKNKVVGMCAYSKRNSRKYKCRKFFYKVLKNILLNSPLVKNKKGWEDYLNAYTFLPEDLENYFGGELTILIVDKNYRNLHIGKELLEKAFSLAKKDNLKNIYILTDETSNYKFYENIGCIKKYETNILNGENGRNDTKGYAYEAKL